MASVRTPGSGSFGLAMLLAATVWVGVAGTLVTAAAAAVVARSPRIHEIIFVVVAFSVIVQGGALPGVAQLAKIPPGAAAEGTPINHLPRRLHQLHHPRRPSRAHET